MVFSNWKTSLAAISSLPRVTDPVPEGTGFRRGYR